MAEMPAFPVIVTHLEDPPGSGLAACSGRPFRTPRGFSNFARWLCTGCARYARPEPLESLDVDRLARALLYSPALRPFVHGSLTVHRALAEDILALLAGDANDE